MCFFGFDAARLVAKPIKLSAVSGVVFPVLTSATSPSSEFRSEAGTRFGVGLHIPVSDWVNISTGYESGILPWTYARTVTPFYRYELAYTKIPIGLEFFPINALKVSLGVSVIYNKYAMSNGYLFTAEQAKINNYTSAFEAGIGYQLGPIGLTASYTSGFLDLSKDLEYLQLETYSVGLTYSVALDKD